MAYSKNANKAENTTRHADYQARVLAMSNKPFRVVDCFYSVKEKTFSCKCVDAADENNRFNLYGTNASIITGVALAAKSDVVARFELVEDKYIQVVEAAGVDEIDIPFK